MAGDVIVHSLWVTNERKDITMGYRVALAEGIDKSRLALCVRPAQKQYKTAGYRAFSASSRMADQK
ncbi:hypothetical protein BFS14_07075 [Serratia fonticola]|nr:hypothetical protein AV650_18165 [Serratia fonticola]OIX86491.1 hypothetical protein BFS14_07075 [Serratia fonticola]